METQRDIPSVDGGEANLVPQSNPSGATLPGGWEAVCPNEALAPVFRWERAPSGGASLTACGNGRQECFGYLRRSIHMIPNRTYRLRVRLEATGLDDINRHLLHGVFGADYNDGVFSYTPDGTTITGEACFPGPAKALDAELRLYFRFSDNGQVWWEHVALTECEPIQPRLVRVACSQGPGDLAHWTRWLDRAGERHVDIALLPEMFNGKQPSAAEPLGGPTGSFLASKAHEWHMYVCGSFYEQRGDTVLNSAPLYDRRGELVGVYSKNMLYDPELDLGATPGVGYPVFQTDCGKVGIIICYDSWFPETVRLLAYKGAEIVLLPNAGYFTSLMPARAADNGVWMVVSSLNCPAGVWDSSGACGGEMDPNPTRFGASTIRSFEKDDELRMIVATLDLSRRYSPHYWGGPMLSAPGGRRVRQTLIAPIEEEIAREARRWVD